MNARPSVSEIDKLLMKYLQNPTVRRFQSGGPAENPEADYYEGGDEDPSGPPKTQPDRTRKRNRYLGAYQKLMSTMGMLNKIGKAVGITKEFLQSWNSGPYTTPPFNPAAPLGYARPLAIVIYGTGQATAEVFLDWLFSTFGENLWQFSGQRSWISSLLLSLWNPCRFYKF